MLFSDTGEMDEFITLGHGSGGKLTGELIRNIFARRFDMNEPLTDSAVVENEGDETAFTTDSYVVDPPFFPGGNIGKLAVCGTVNDLAVSGAIPRYLSVSFILEEGFPVKKLIEVVESMAMEAKKAKVKIVTGDTKVVEKGKCDGIFITTSGTGVTRKGCKDIGTGRLVRPGDKLIINGAVGNHSIAVMGARKQLSFVSDVVSDCAALNHLIGKVLDISNAVHFMRDVTRGGLAAILNELSDMTGLGIFVDEENIPVDESVRGLCEMLGFDPLSLANEGKVLIVAGVEDAGQILDCLRADEPGKNASVIGEITENRVKEVILKTLSGGNRILDVFSGLQLPRIC